jgi:hypothetical protein
VHALVLPAADGSTDALIVDFTHTYVREQCAHECTENPIREALRPSHYFLPDSAILSASPVDSPKSVYFKLATGYFTWSWPPGTPATVAFDEITVLHGASPSDRRHAFKPRSKAPFLIEDVATSRRSPVLVLDTTAARTVKVRLGVSEDEIEIGPWQTFGQLRDRFFSLLEAARPHQVANCTPASVILRGLNGVDLCPSAPVSDTEVVEAFVRPEYRFSFEFLDGRGVREIPFMVVLTTGYVMEVLTRKSNPSAGEIRLMYAGWVLPNRKICDLGIPDGARIVVGLRTDDLSDWGTETVTIKIGGVELRRPKATLVSEVIAEFGGEVSGLAFENGIVLNDRARLGELGSGIGVLDVIRQPGEFGGHRMSVVNSGSQEEEPYFAPLSEAARAGYDKINREEEFYIRKLPKRDVLFRRMEEETIVGLFVKHKNDWAKLRWVVMMGLA